MRDPAWNRGRRACTLRIHPADAGALGIEDGVLARVTTAAGEVEVEAELDDGMRHGQVAIPHGFGLRYQDEEYGVAVNRLTPADRRDPIAGTPWHRYVPCRAAKA
jgi:anaerobic selenocysteine-containing dehydrogenase